MNKFYSTLFVAFSTFASFGQGFLISPTDSIHQDIQVGSYYTSTINLPHDNLTTDTVVIAWEVISIDLPAGNTWDYSYCDYTSCHTGNITDAIMTPILPGQSAFFKVNLVAPQAGFGMFKIKVYNVDNPASYEVMTFTFDATLEVSALEKGQLVRVFPNPMTDDKLTISNVLPGSSLKITNSLGQLVVAETITGNHFLLQNSNLHRGVYFVQLALSNEVYTTRKLIVK